MKQSLRKIVFAFYLVIWGLPVAAQCLDCGNGSVDAGETNLNCPQDVAHSATCTSPCAQPGAFETTAGIRVSYDFVGSTVWSTAGLPAGWSFAGAPSATTAGALPAADAYGAKAGLIQPNCSGSCTLTNGFCIGNLASSSAVGAGGVGGKLGANFDGRPNINQNLSYAVLRGQGSPTLVSPTYNMSAVEGFKVQFWLFPSETSCGQLNSWGSCVGNTAFLDFSSNGGTSWTQVMTINLSSTNSDMCVNNTSNTLWLTESSWTRVCLTVFKTDNSPGNFYTAASGTTAASGIMVNNSYFVSNFKFRVRYSQTASCTSGITTTNPGRYLAIDYPVVTSGNEMIPCGISFANLCGYGADNNDDAVGSLGTATTVVFGTTRRGQNQAERGVEIMNSQTAAFASQNLSGSGLASNFDLCNPEGGDKQCIDWRTNTNFHTVVYECITDWEAPSGTGINLNFYKGTTPQSFGLTKVTTAGKTATIGWRYSGSRFVSCSATSDLNPGCNGYLFRSGSLPIQFARGFYSLAVNSTGQSWSYYGASSCSHYFNGPFMTPIAVPDTVAGAGDYTVCVLDKLRFTGTVEHCLSSGGLTGSSTLTISGPGGFSETIASGATGTVDITTAGYYWITAEAPTTPVQCVDCSRSVCIYVSDTDITDCISALPVEMIGLEAQSDAQGVLIRWKTITENNNDYFAVQRSQDGIDFESVGTVDGAGNTTTLQTYALKDLNPFSGDSYYRVVQSDFNGTKRYSPLVSAQWQDPGILIVPNPGKSQFEFTLPVTGVLEIRNVFGAIVYPMCTFDSGSHVINLELLDSGTYVVSFQSMYGLQLERLIIID